ncbi:SigE family RNA polymerase sigma factor [Promicromonospora sp. NPDC059942]|uniref:SigE family RNA polymerase sigma factor n=1 Tax=Promicromonospora sp. NPDC059942 TaxID=3347009 RepID=UPI00364D417A
MSIHTPERAEVRVVRTKDQEFVAFVGDARPYLFRTAFLLCGDPDRAEDLVQGTFERVYRSWHRVHTEPRAYARRVLVNLRTDTWRRSSRTDLPGDDAIRLPDTPDHAARVAVRAELVHALAQLPLQQRRVVVMRHLLDLSEAQVADELGRSVGTVKSANARGLENLRTILERADLADIPVPHRDAAETLGESRAALHRRRTAQGVLGGVAALLVAFFLAGPISLPGVGPVALPGSEWFRSLVGLERPDGDAGPRPGDCPAGTSDQDVRPWLEGRCVLAVDAGAAPDAVEAGVVVRVGGPTAGAGMPGTLAADGSVITFADMAPGSDNGEGDGDPDQELALELRAATGETSPVAVNGMVDGHRAEIADVARQGNRVAWLEVANRESESSPWAIRVVDDVRNPEVRTLMESSGEPVPLGYRIALSSASLYLQRIADQGEIEQVQVPLATGATEILASGPTAFAVTPDAVVWAANNVRTGIKLADRSDDGVRQVPVGLAPAAGYPLETVTELAASDALLAWGVAGDLHVFDRETGAMTLVELDGEAGGIDVDGRAVAWTSTRDNEGTGYLLLDGRAYRLEGQVVEVAVAGEWLSWVTLESGGGSLREHLARIAGTGS